VKARNSVGSGLLLGYARVSKGDEQTSLAGQYASCRWLSPHLRGGCFGWPLGPSGATRLLDHLREGTGWWSGSSTARHATLKDLLHIMERIAAVGAGFRSLTESIDTTSPAGRMMMQIVASFAEFERTMIRERTSAGLTAARAEGRAGGRRRKLDVAKRVDICVQRDSPGAEGEDN
jgi:DNA invertase Pin-like site-specific DNA recombinase